MVCESNMGYYNITVIEGTPRTNLPYYDAVACRTQFLEDLEAVYIDKLTMERIFRNLQ